MAAGAAGNVWRATYQTQTVAAKELYALADVRTPVTTAIKELVNEVRCRGECDVTILWNL